MTWKSLSPASFMCNPILRDGPDPPKKGTMPLWCSLITRQVSLKSPEAISPAGQKALKKELDGLRSRKTWDEDNPMELNALLKDPKYPEAMIGRVFGIMGVRSDEVKKSLEDLDMKFRVVFQGSNVRTKTGTSAIDLYDEVSNAPASFTASRVVLGCAAVSHMRVSFRDALQAFLQAKISTPGRVSTWIELPREWLPASWFYDGEARTKPKYHRPVCELLLALYGHPESGPLYDNLMEKVLVSDNWERVYEWPGVFIHPDGSVLVIYVDDLMMAGIAGVDTKHWESL